MVYVYSKKSEIDNYLDENLEIEKIEEVLKEMGMDVKGISKEKDPELKIEITAERLDLISSVGICKAIKYFIGKEKDIKKYKIKKGVNQLIIDESAKLSRPKTIAAIIRNAPMSESFLNKIIDIQEKIHESFGRGRKKAAIGIYPLEKIKFPVIYKSENPNKIKFQPLMSEKIMDGNEILNEHEVGKKYSHLLNKFEKYPIFVDANNKILSMPPIINSYDTGRVENYHKDLFIECSGYNIQLLDNILKILTITFTDLGAEIETIEVINKESKDIYELKLENRIETISINYINSLIGIELSNSEIEKYLNKVMYSLKSIKEDILEIEIPPYKLDVWNDCDIADDIAKGYGYNNIIIKNPNIVSTGKILKYNLFKENFSNTLVELGFLEIYSYMLTSTTIQHKKMTLKENNNKNKFNNYIKLIDSADQGLNMIRTKILPELLTSLHLNRKNKYPQKIFETGFIIKPSLKEDIKAKDKTHICVCIADPKSNYTIIKTIFDTLTKLNEINTGIKIVDNTKYEFLIKGRSGEIYYKDKRIGFIGEIHPQILENFGLIVPVSCFEINLEEIFEF